MAIYSGSKQFIGLAKESTVGTPVPMTVTVPVTKFDPEDKPKWLMDKSWNGSMSTDYGMQQGVIPADLSFSGNVYPDTIVHLLANILGDRTTVGGGTATTLSSAAVKGATSVSVAGTVSVGAQVQIEPGTSTLSETRTATAVTGSGPYVVTFATPLLYGHASGAAVTPLYSHAISLLNSGQGQPVTHTFTHYMGPGTNGARTYSSACLDSLDFKFNGSDNNPFGYSAKAQTWPSSEATVQPTAAPSGIQAISDWKTNVSIGGSPNNTVMDLDVNIKRKLEPDYTLQGSQAPFSITRGEVNVQGKMTFLAQDDSAYQAMRSNAQPPLTVNLGPISMLIPACAYETAKPNTGKEAVEYGVNWKAVIGTTAAGASGGLSPLLVTVANAIPGTSF